MTNRIATREIIPDVFFDINKDTCIKCENMVIKKYKHDPEKYLRCKLEKISSGMKGWKWKGIMTGILPSRWQIAIECKSRHIHEDWGKGESDE